MIDAPSLQQVFDREREQLERDLRDSRSEVTHDQIGEARSAVITWNAVPGARGYSVAYAPAYAFEPPMPPQYRKLDRALRRLEAAVTAWERALAPPTTYRFSIEAVDAQASIPVARAVP